jgi:hypothetical protein
LPALAQGWPIATGVIEGACRHLVKDRLDITGARWGLAGGEAVLKLRALVSNGDFDQQIKTKQIKVYVYNSQNATPDVQAQVNAAKAAGIPVTTITETLTPAGASFQDWQVAQLNGLKQALGQATGR